MKTKMFIVILILIVGIGAAFSGGQKEAAGKEEPAVTAITNEAPELQRKVAVGQLPELKDRLPEEPLVVKPVEEIGQYGGTWRRAEYGNFWGSQAKLHQENLVCWSANYKDIAPNIAKAWEWSSDGKSITFYLRKGMKWSDGKPFTTDDILFWYEDIMLNKELTPAMDSTYKAGGEPATMEVIDDYTFKMSFIQPYGMFLENIISPWKVQYAPKHYFTQFHAKYASEDELKKIMEKESFDTWVDLFKSKNEQYRNPGCPQIDAWIPHNTGDQAVQIFLRNPYYWKVDTEGNQLPYIDKIEVLRTTNREATILKAMAGEIDYQAAGIAQNVEDYSMLMQYKEKGDYQLVPLIPVGSNHGVIKFNFWHEDPVIRELLNDKNFRIAISLAIDRDEVNKLYYKDLGTPAQPFPDKGTPWYVEKYSKSYIEYDPAKANKMLDALGLKWDANHEYRLRSDGKRLRFELLGRGWPATVPEMSGLFQRKYFKDIGIEIVPKTVARTLYQSRVAASDFDLICEGKNMGYVGSPPVVRSSVVPTWTGKPWGVKWVLWFDSDGKEGEEPPEDVKRIMELRDEVISETSSEKRIKLTKEILGIHSDNMWVVGVITEPPLVLFAITTNRFRNVPPQMNSQHRSEYCPQFFIKK